MKSDCGSKRDIAQSKGMTRLQAKQDPTEVRSDEDHKFDQTIKKISPNEDESVRLKFDSLC
jgi:hypothetical protein